MPVTFFTGRHTYTIICAILIYISLISFTTTFNLSIDFFGTGYLQYFNFIELLEAFIIFLVGFALLPGMRFVESENSRRLQFCYGLTVFAICLLPIYGSCVVGIASRFHLPPFNTQDVKGPEEIFPKDLVPISFNAIIIGAIALIFLHYLGVLGGLGSIVVVYPILMYLSVSPIASFVPYAATGPAYHPTPRVAWACVFVLAATLVWSFDRNGKLGWLRRKN